MTHGLIHCICFHYASTEEMRTVVMSNKIKLTKRSVDPVKPPTDENFILIWDKDIPDSVFVLLGPESNPTYSSTESMADSVNTPSGDMATSPQIRLVKKPYAEKQNHQEHRSSGG